VPTIADLIDELVSKAHPDGGWGYVPGEIAQLEPTCLALLALSLDSQRQADAIAKGRAFIARCRQSDAGYPLAKGRTQALWSTAVVLFTEAALGAAPAALAPTVGFLLHYEGKIPPTPQYDELKVVDANHDIDLKLVGWPWAENNFSWVEPTAWACLALRRCGLDSHARVQEGLRLLLDRAMDTGGVNYGNRRILDKILDPIPGPTALMLLAVQGRDHPRIGAAIRYLIQEMSDGDPDHLCWTKLALDLYPNQPGVPEALAQLDQRILDAVAQRQHTDWVRPTNVRLALAALALGTARHNVFWLPEVAAQAPIVSPPTKSKIGGLGLRLGAWFRGLALKGASQLRQFPEFSGVHIARAPDYNGDLAAILQQQFEHFRAKVPLKDRRVVLKPNLVEYHRDKVINTDPRVVGAVIELCKREGAREVIVAEGPGHWRNVEYLVAACGLGEVLQKHKVRFVDLNHDEPVKMPNLGQLTGLETIFVARTIATADVVISLPKLKTHHWAGATLSLKNLFGTVPGICYGWPKNELHWRGIDNSIVDIALTRTPDLAIVDGIIGMEGDGPLMGEAKPLGALIMGHDLLAVDATCCRLMRLDPDKIGYLVLGHAKRLGRMKAEEIPQLGESIESLAQPFAQVAHFRELCVRPA
jgi:uncharacterized protein (DUF362 family)